MKLTHAICLVVLALFPAAVFGQVVPSPLLYVKLLGPEGMHVTFYSGAPSGRDFAAPVTVGLRPGYVYRFKVSGFPERPGVDFFPTLEIRGTLQLPAKQSPADHPAPVVLDRLDIESLIKGALVTKVIYLESPDRAAPLATDKDHPLQTNLQADRDPLDDARALGRPVAILRIGSRTLKPEDVARLTIPGTILLPGETPLTQPLAPPCVPWLGMAVYDPILGPRMSQEECLHDGGDSNRPAGIDNTGKIGGLDPSDTIAEYVGADGKKRIAPSNRICLCVPRFAVLRSELPVGHYAGVVALHEHDLLEGQQMVKRELASKSTQQNEQLRGTTGRSRPSAAVTMNGPARLVRLDVLSGLEMEVGLAAVIHTPRAQQLSKSQRTILAQQVALAQEFNQKKSLAGYESSVGPAAVGVIVGGGLVRATASTREIDLECSEEIHLPAKPLVLFKWANAQSAQIGDVVTFYLKYSNVGGQPITDVAVSDSLTSRLEYVPGSAKSDRNTVFMMEENEAGSLILRWEVSGKLLPGQSGVVSFQAKVR